MRITRSPVLLVVTVASAIFVCETIVMYLVPLCAPISLPWIAVTDSALLVLFLFPILYFLVFRQWKLREIELLESNDRLQAQIAEREQTEEALRASEVQLRHFSSQLLSAQETERKRIAAELHDELAQDLASLKLQMTFIEKNLQDNQTELKNECEETLHFLHDTIAKVRRLSRDLIPHALEHFGLSTALQRLVKDFAGVYHINAKMDTINVDGFFSREAQIMTYRIFQEVLNNIRKHAQAQNVSVVMKQLNDRISFSIEDDGKGFDLKQIVTKDPAQKGLGLMILHERVKMLGGSLFVETNEGRGTRIAFTALADSGEAH